MATQRLLSALFPKKTPAISGSFSLLQPHENIKKQIVQFLGLEWTYAKASVCKGFGSFRSYITYAHFRYTHQPVTEKVITCILRYSPNIRNFDFSRVEKPKGTVLSKLRPFNLRMLTLFVPTDDSLSGIKGLAISRLELVCSRFVTDKGMKSLRKLPLRDLTITGCEKISPEGFKFLRTCPLRRLRLIHCEHVSSSSLAMIAKYPSLKSLSLNGRVKSGYNNFEALSGSSIQFFTLDRKVTDGDLLHLSKLSLLRLDVSMNGDRPKDLSPSHYQYFGADIDFTVSEEGIQHLLKMSPQSVKLHYRCNEFNIPRLLLLSKVPLTYLKLSCAEWSVDRTYANAKECQKLFQTLRTVQTWINNPPKEQTAFYIALQNGNTSALKAFFTHKYQKIEHVLPYKPIDYLLVWAAEQGLFKIVKDLIEEGEVNLNASGYDGQTSLMKACKKGYIHIVRLLVSVADINRRDRNYKTALIIALEEDHLEIAAILANQEGIRIDYRDRYNRNTAIMIAALRKHLEMYLLLRRNGRANISEKNARGKSARDYYLENRLYDLI